ncbi:MAG TPA: DUF192 domain-containing protein, partial [Longimicrobiales bacterium]|nr:DUF192 domain-containing protein [Longimicrobiales bacterium]
WLAAACAPSSESESQTADLRASEPVAAPEGGTGTDVPARPGAASAWIIFGADTVVAEVARTEDERAQGLMHREALDPDAGMLFVFPESAVRSFWMQNTYIPLDIAYMDAQFRIVDIQQMEPMTTEPHMSRAPAMYALEVNQGWFRDHGVSVGDAPQVVFGS